jgi:hypothetical protein
LSDVELADLVPETRTWNNGEPVSLEGWIFALGRYEHMIAYGELFWPDFVEHDCCILLAGGEESYAGFMKQTGGNKQAVEAMINHLHVIDLVYQPDAEPRREQLVYLGRLLREMWQAKLAKEFPDRRFVVHFEEGGLSDDDAYVFVVNFHQEWGSCDVPSASAEV